MDGKMLDVHKIREVPISEQAYRLVEVAYQQAVELRVAVRVGTLLGIVPPFVLRKSGLEELLYKEVERMVGMDGL
jgi:hypothetical protein